VNSEELQEAYVSYVNETDRDNTPIFYDLFDELAAEIHPVNVEKGFWGPPVMMDEYVAKLALIHSEVTEILEALRKSQGSDKVTEEFADVLIRTYDLYGELVNAGEADPELYAVMMKKIETNKTRPAKHGNRWG
jgi:NTP pyrophosphatase (non-canonical NTP hydrolase)